MTKQCYISTLDEYNLSKAASVAAEQQLVYETKIAIRITLYSAVRRQQLSDTWIAAGADGRLMDTLSIDQ